MVCSHLRLSRRRRREAHRPAYDLTPHVGMVDAEATIGSADRVEIMLNDFKEEFQTEEGAKRRSTAKSVLADEGQAAYKKQDYEKSLQKFAKYLAAVLLDRSVDNDIEASLLANVGSCLHHLGEDELAKEFATNAGMNHLRRKPPHLTRTQALVSRHDATIYSPASSPAHMPPDIPLAGRPPAPPLAQPPGK